MVLQVRERYVHRARTHYNGELEKLQILVSPGFAKRLTACQDHPWMRRAKPLTWSGMSLAL